VQKTVIRMPSAVSTDRCPRHTDATILLTGREPVYVVSQRLGHASGVITQMAYAHVLPGSQRDAAERFASLIERGKHNERAGTSERHHGRSWPIVCRSHLRRCLVRGASRLLRTCRRSLVG
jgi:hypothetical protein